MALEMSHNCVLHIYFRFGNRDKVPWVLKRILYRSTTRKEIYRIQQFANRQKYNNITEAFNTAKFHLRWADKNVPIIKDAIKHIQWKLV